MLMDIACPAELLRVEQAQFGDGGRLAYLTFLSETDRPILAVSGRMTLLCAGEAEHRQVSFDNLSALPGATFTCHLPLDDFPLFDVAQMSIEHVAFDSGDPWALHPRRLMDCTPPPLPEGPERVALVALAGPDTACFPEKRDGLWICVCGRFNRWRWPLCRRCGRERDAALERFTPRRVLAEYQEAVEAIRSRDQERLVARARPAAVKRDEGKKAAGKKAPKARAGAKPARKKQSARKERAVRKKRAALGAAQRRVIAAIAGVLLLSLLIWGALRLAGHTGGGQQTVEGTPTPPVDYLDRV